MDRPGGYTRILKIGNRLGDNAEMCIIELVDYNENMLKDTTVKTKTKSRRGGGAAKAKTTTPKAAAPKAEAKPVVEDAVVIDETKTEETV